MKKTNAIATIALSLLVGACATEPPVKPVEQTATKQPSVTPAVTPTVQQAPIIKEVSPIAKPELPPGIREIRFAYDSSDLNAQAQEIINQHAKFLLKHPHQKIVIEGHADERGADQYNYVLGEKRAATIRQALLAKGVASEQLRMISYGETQPKVVGQGEAFWQQNRRASLSYVNPQITVTQSNDAKLQASPMVVSDN